MEKPPLNNDFPPKPRVTSKEDVKNVYDLDSFFAYAKHALESPGRIEEVAKLLHIKEEYDLGHISMYEAAEQIHSLIYKNQP